MRAEKFHREKLKEIGYKDEAIEKLVTSFWHNGKYGFAEKYHAEMLRYSEAWSLEAILSKLIESANILLIDKNYDGHGYELINEARDKAKNIVEQIKIKQ